MNDYFINIIWLIFWTVVVISIINMVSSKKMIRIVSQNLKNIKSSDLINFSDIKKFQNNNTYKYIQITVVFTMVILFLYAVFSEDNTYLVIIFLLFAILGIIGFFLPHTDDWFKKFAENNGFYYFKEGILEASISGLIFQLGSSALFKNVIALRINNHDVIFFHYEYKINDAYEKIYQFTIFEIEFDTIFPTIILSPKKSFLQADLFVSHDGFVKPVSIHLDGKMYESHELVAEEKYQLEVLQIFTLDFIEELTKYNNLRLEFNNNKINIIYENFVIDRTEIENIFRLANYLVVKIGPTKGLID